VHDIIEYGLADISADALSQPGHQVKADEGAYCHSRGDTYQQNDSAAQILTGAAAEALVYQYLQAPAQGQGGASGEQQRDTGAGNSEFVLPQEAQYWQ
jgi:hypothetical protein